VRNGVGGDMSALNTAIGSGRGVEDVGDGEREVGSGIWEGVIGRSGCVVDAVDMSCLFGGGGCFDAVGLVFDFPVPAVVVVVVLLRAGSLSLGLEALVGEGIEGTEVEEVEGMEEGSAGVSDTQGNPECGPRKLRIEEKCSQS
jgi:hypothetical protein